MDLVDGVLVVQSSDPETRHRHALCAALSALLEATAAARRDGFRVGVNLNQFGQYVIEPPAGLLSGGSNGKGS